MHSDIQKDPFATGAGATRRRWADPRRHADDVIETVVESIRRRWREALGAANLPRTRSAIILGTGLGGVADAIDVDVEIPYGEIPPFVAPTAVSHTGRLIAGRLDGVPVIAFAGRVHVYEGHGLRQVTLPVEVAAALGAEVLIASNASGGLNPTYRAGDVVVVDDHLDLLFAAPLMSDDARVATVYDRELIELAHRSARAHGGRVHRGVYAAVPGPNYETRAEIRMLRSVGADIVGMSTVPEAVAARRLGLRAAALSVVTNQCNPDRVVHVTGSEVAESAARAGDLIGRIVRDLVTHVGATPVSP